MRAMNDYARRLFGRRQNPPPITQNRPGEIVRERTPKIQEPTKTVREIQIDELSEKIRYADYKDRIPLIREKIDRGLVDGITRFMELCMVGSLEDVKEEFDLSSVNTIDGDGNNSLFYAGYGGNKDVLEFLINLNYSFFNHVNVYGIALSSIISNTPSLSECWGVLRKMKSWYLSDRGTVNYPGYYEPPYSYDLIRIIVEDDLDRFVDEFSMYSDDVLLIACEYHAWAIMKYCVQKRIGLSFISDMSYTAFSYACYHGDRGAIRFLMDTMNTPILSIKDSNGYSAIDYIQFDKALIIELRARLQSQDAYTEPFRVFTMDEFDFPPMTEDLKGTYGSALRVVHRSSGLNMIFKKYHKCDSELLTEGTTKEIVLTRFLNTVDPNVAVQLYGIVIDSGCVHLVQEALVYTLGEYFDLIKTMNRDDAREYRKRLLFGVLSNIAIMNNAGVQHNDLSARNIMIDSNQRIRFIDLGLAEYWGIGPPVHYIDMSVITDYIAAPEITKEIIIDNVVVDDPFRINGARKTLNSDVFSAASTFLNGLNWGVSWYRYISRNGFIYRTDTYVYTQDDTDKLKDKLKELLGDSPKDDLSAPAEKIEDEENVIEHTDNLEDTENVIEDSHSTIEDEEEEPVRVPVPGEFHGLRPADVWELEPELVDVLTKMLEADPRKRWFAKDCLKHKYFTGVDYDIVYREQDMTELPQENITRYSREPYELVCAETIRTASMFTKFVEKPDMVGFAHSYNTVVSWLIEVARRAERSIDTIANTISKFADLMVTNKIPKGKLQGYSVVLLLLTSYFFESLVITYEQLVMLCMDIYTKDDLLGFAEDIILNYANYTSFTPVSSHIEYIVTRHQEIGTDTRECMRIESSIKAGLLKWLFGNTEAEPFSWELVVAIYETVVDEPILLPNRNPDLNGLVYSIIQSVNTIEIAGVIDEYSAAVY
jgi:serine/threonine protein kinase